MDIYTRNTQKADATGHKLRLKRQQLINKEMVECSFHPTLKQSKPQSKSQSKSQSKHAAGPNEYNTLYQRSLKRAQEKLIINQLAQLERASLEAANCTFQPRINPNTQEMLHRKSQRPQRRQQTGNCTFQPRINPNTQEMLHRKSQRPQRRQQTGQQTEKMYSRSMKKPLQKPTKNPTNKKSVPSSSLSSSPPPPPPPSSSINLKDIHDAYQCAWEGIVAKQRGVRRPTPVLCRPPTAMNHPLTLYHNQILTSLNETNATRTDNNDSEVRQESLRRSALHRQIGHSVQIKINKTLMKHKQKLLSTLQKERSVVLQRLLLYYRKRMKDEGYGYTES
jgi:hypothetical protein